MIVFVSESSKCSPCPVWCRFVLFSGSCQLMLWFNSSELCEVTLFYKQCCKVFRCVKETFKLTRKLSFFCFWQTFIFLLVESFMFPSCSRPQIFFAWDEAPKAKKRNIYIYMFFLLLASTNFWFWMWETFQHWLYWSWFYSDRPTRSTFLNHH